MVKAQFGPGTYFIGDICYALKEDEYYEIWGNQNNYEDGSYDGFAVAGTAYGDGVYTGTDGVDYGVDAGVIGVVEKSHWGDKYDTNTLNGLGKIIEVKDKLIFEAENGNFFFDYDNHVLEINTQGYEEDEEDEYYEEDDIYESLKLLNKKIGCTLRD